MRTLLRGGEVVNVFTGEVERADVLMEGGRILGVGDYAGTPADIVRDVTGKVLCPGLIDGHIHIESTMLLPAELARVCVAHGTTAIVADPHEIANVCGMAGIAFMLEASEGLPVTTYFMLPSCVPATPFDESGAVLGAAQLRPLYGHPRVLGLAEVMNYPGVLSGDPDVAEKLADARRLGKVIDGHAPLLTGAALDRYIAAGVGDDHECSTFEEARERIRKGQWVMIRQGTAARNLDALLPLFEPPYAQRCLLVTDDRHPADLMGDGHIDAIIRRAAAAGRSPVTGIQMATLHAAQCFGLRGVGAVAPGYAADVLVLDDLPTMAVRDVYRAGERVVHCGRVRPFGAPVVRSDLVKAVRNSFYLHPLRSEDFAIAPQSDRCRVIRLVPDQLLTDEWIAPVNWRCGGVDISRDIVKLAVIERHMNTGHRGLGFIAGLGLRSGAIASSVAHDSHNLIVAGTNDADMAAAGNCVLEMGGGCAVVDGGRVLSHMPLPIAGLMGEEDAAGIAAKNEALRRAVHALGAPETIEPFMSLAFVSLPVIPALKMSPQGLIDVLRQRRVPLYVQDESMTVPNGEHGGMCDE
ncbi:MAG: adenine deaminase [Candidatus Ventricola sp.]